MCVCGWRVLWGHLCPGSWVGWSPLWTLWVCCVEGGMTCWSMGSNIRRSVMRAETLLQKGKGQQWQVQMCAWTHIAKPDYTFLLSRICFILKMRRTYLLLKQRQPNRAPGATMLMLSGALTSPSHCTEAALCDSNGAALPPVIATPLFTPLHIWQVRLKKPTASYLLTSTPAL